MSKAAMANGHPRLSLGKGREAMSTHGGNEMHDAQGPSSESKNQLVVVGAGIEWGQTTLAAQRAMQLADQVVFAVADPLTARWIRELSPSAESLVYPRDGRPRQAIYAAMVDHIMDALAKNRRVCAVFYGCPAVLVQPAHDAIRRARERGYAARMLPGVSFLDCLFADLGVDPGALGCSVHEAGQFLARGGLLDARSHLVLCQVGLIGNRAAFDADNHVLIERALERLGKRLQRHYSATHEIVLYEAARHAFEAPRAERRLLADIAGARVSGISTLYVPPLRLVKRADDRLGEFAATLAQTRSSAAAEPIASRT
jgi:hypothetical protein